jgi:hypothetical protein
MNIFLDDDDVVKLTGKKLKAGQVSDTNIICRPRHAVTHIDKPWTPNLLKNGAQTHTE